LSVNSSWIGTSIDFPRKGAFCGSRFIRTARFGELRADLLDLAPAPPPSEGGMKGEWNDGVMDRYGKGGKPDFRMARRDPRGKACPQSSVFAPAPSGAMCLIVTRTRIAYKPGLSRKKCRKMRIRSQDRILRELRRAETKGRWLGWKRLPLLRAVEERAGERRRFGSMKRPLSPTLSPLGGARGKRRGICATYAGHLAIHPAKRP
jgi:hypothetical protein